MAASTLNRPESEAEAPPKVRKPGRPRVIPVDLEPVVIELHRLGYGYGASARILSDDYKVCLWTLTL